MSSDVLIVGGGAIGAACAFECASAGLNVTLLEKRHIGSGASGSSAAMTELQIDAYRGDPFFSLAKQSRDLFPTLHQEIKELTGDDFKYETCGILQLASTQADALYLEKEAERQNKLGLAAQWFSVDDLQTELPILNTTHFGGVLYKEDGQVNGEVLTSSLVKAAKMRGAKIFEDVGEARFEKKDGKIIGIRTKDSFYLAPTIVLAVGAWTDNLLTPLNISLGIKPIRGQLIIYDTPQRFIPYPVYTRSSGYITPKAGYTLVGSTMEHVGFDESTTEKARIDLHKMAVDLVPNFARKNIRGMSAGLRPGSPDGLPFIGPLAEHNEVLIAAGHARNGILLTPITGKIIAALVARKPLPIQIAPFLPSRSANGRPLPL